MTAILGAFVAVPTVAIRRAPKAADIDAETGAEEVEIPFRPAVSSMIGSGTVPPSEEVRRRASQGRAAALNHPARPGAAEAGFRRAAVLHQDRPARERVGARATLVSPSHQHLWPSRLGRSDAWSPNCPN